jgi:alkylhydroperoxidase/carboxymuconolactone decarboxylase family protein YurZ
MTPDAFKRWCCPTDAPRSETTQTEALGETVESPHTRVRPENGADHPKLEDLIPIAVVIAAGCEPCAERMVRRAVEAGSLPRHVLRTIAIVADLRERECFRTKIAPEVVERMSGPLARARKTLEELAGTGVAAGPRHSCT